MTRKMKNLDLEQRSFIYDIVSHTKFYCIKKKKKIKKIKIEAKFELENCFAGLFDLRFTRVPVLCENETTFYIDIRILM